MKFEGAYTALITPFHDDFSLDYEGLKRNVQFQIANEMDGVVVLGSTGESATITPEEQKKMISVVVKETKGKTFVIVGTGSNCTEETIKKTLIAKELGADAALMPVPYYNKPTQEGIFRHFERIASHCDFPIIIYNVPSRTGVNLEPETFKKIANFPGILGLKECNFSQVSSILNLRSDLSLLSGDDVMTLPIMALGGRGVISVVSNIVPKEVKKLVQKALSGHFPEAKQIHFQLHALFDIAFIESNPIPIKEAMNLLGMAAGPLRLPLSPLSSENKKKLQHVLVNYEKKSEFRESLLSLSLS